MSGAEQTAGIGHNLPPDDLSTIKERVNDFGRAARAWGENGVTDEDDAKRIDAFIRDTRDLYRMIDERRAAEKRPHDEAAKAVQMTYAPLLDLVKKAGATAKDLLTAYLDAKEAAARAAERRRQAEAAEREAESRRKAREAEQTGDLLAAQEAEEAAAKAAAEAEREEAVKAQVKGVGPATGLRTFRHAKVTSAALLVAHYRKHPEVLALCEKLANADIRAAKGKAIEIPGVEIVEERRVA